jgi:hypothetical protein
VTRRDHGTLLMSFIGNGSPGGGLFDYTPIASFTLLGNTTYWAVFGALTGAPDKQFPVYTEASHTETGSIGWSIGDNYASRPVNNGVPGSWTAGPVGPSTPLQFAVNAAAVPEPSSVALIILSGGGGVVCWLRRRRALAK